MALYRGAGGVEWEIDPPTKGQAKERFDAQVESGELTLVEPAKAPAATKAPAKAEG